MNKTTNTPTTSMDKFLDGKITIEQLKDGGRSGSDTILLSAAVPAKSGATVLEIGTGNATASIALAYLVRDIEIIAIDNDDTNVSLARRNVQLNDMNNQITIRNLDILDTKIRSHLISSKKNILFDHIFMNPPYFDSQKNIIPTSHHNKIAKTFSVNDLPKWIDVANNLLKHNGTLTIINRIENLLSIINSLGNHGSINILPLTSKRGKDADRIIVQLTKGSKSKARLLYPLIMHDENGHYTDTVEKILRGNSRFDINKLNYAYL